ncbi:MAG: type IV secretion system DNA-binding domain-containing protein [Bauldia litoralis]|uniref:type IV secretory system conjugative DNA transfer family protein n=3 Tax=Alphaproteobacteria TaxID=28211 RepID=UPI00329A4160
MTLSARLGGRPMTMHYKLGTLHTGFPISLSAEERRLHIDIVGQSGTGKSTLLFNMMMADLAAGRGFVLIDPHGDLAQAVADATPKHRTNDVIYFDPLDPSHAVGFNPLSSDISPALLTAHIVSAFKHIWRDSWGPRLEYILTNSVRLLLATPGQTLLGLPRLLVDDDFRARLIERCDDPVVRLFWLIEFAGYGDRLRAEAIAPIQNKIGQLAGNPIIRSVIGQPSTIHISSIINGDKILIANLSKRIGEEPSHLLGALLVTAIAQAAEGRASLPEHQRRDFTLYVDEFQNFATDTFATILSEMRKWRLNLVLANQFLGQVPDILRQSIFGNVGTLVVFRVGAEDAPMLGAQLGHPNPAVLTETSNHAAWIKMMRGNAPSSPQFLITFPPSPQAKGRLPAIIARTHARHARPRPIVEAGIAAVFARTHPARRLGPRSAQRWA